MGKKARRRPAANGPAAAHRPRLSLCMIVRDEERYLPDCLASVAGLVDEIVVVDTGSRDRTVALAEAAGAHVFHFAWCNDFAAARNESLCHASGDWVLYLDADERLDQASHSQIRRSIVSNVADAYSLLIVNKASPGTGAIETCHPYLRLFRLLPGVRFEGAVHEQIAPSLARLGRRTAHSSATILHLGYALSPEEMRQKAERNLPLLLTEATARADDPFVHFNLGKTLVVLGRHAEALGELRQATSLPGGKANFKAYAHLVAGTVLLNHLGDLRGAVSQADLALSYDASLIGPRLLLAQVLLAEGHALAAAQQVGLAIADVSRGKQSPGRIDRHEPLHRLWGLLASCQFRAGRWEDAARSAALSVREGGIAWEVFAIRGVAEAWRGDFVAAEQALAAAEAQGASKRLRGLSAYCRGLVAVVRGDGATAASHLTRAVALSPEDTLAQAELSRYGCGTDAAEPCRAGARCLLRLQAIVLREMRDWRQLATTLRRLNAAGEDPALILEEMGTTLARLGRTDLAFGYLTRAEALRLQGRQAVLHTA